MPDDELSGWTCQECGAFTRVVYDPENCGDDTAALVYETHVMPCSKLKSVKDCCAMNEAEDASCILSDGHSGQHMDGRQRRWETR